MEEQDKQDVVDEKIEEVVEKVEADRPEEN